MMTFQIGDRVFCWGDGGTVLGEVLDVDLMEPAILVRFDDVTDDMEELSWVNTHNVTHYEKEYTLEEILKRL